MKWILSHASDEIHHWQLEDEKGSQSLTFNRQWLSLRLSGTSKRLLFLRVQGLLQKRVFLQTEYGFLLGETALADKISAGPFTLNDQEFFYEVKDGQLFIFNSDRQLRHTCQLPAMAGLEKLEFYALLFGFAWFVMPEALTEQKELLSVTA